jgi:hypothetical protein
MIGKIIVMGFEKRNAKCAIKGIVGTYVTPSKFRGKNRAKKKKMIIY